MNYLSKLRVKSFGPIRNDNNIEINKLTIFIGDQGTGKSTLAKLVSTFLWIEKSLVRGNINQSWLKQRSFKDTFLSYHRLDSYLSKDSILEYDGDAYLLKVDNNRVFAEKKDAIYNLPQIMYVPAERNFISYVRSANELKIASEALQDFLTEFNNSKNNITINNRKMPFGNIYLDYDKLNDLVSLVGDNYKIKLSESSSGLQSATPLYLVSQYLANSIQSSDGQRMSEKERNRFMTEVRNLLLNDELTEEQRRLALSTLTERFNKKAFINIVEEPEQNLFPESQWKIVKKLIEFNNLNINNKLIMTTHSPYIISQLGIGVQLNELRSIKSGFDVQKYKELLDNFRIDSKSLSIYQLDETGNVNLLDKEFGIPSDNNYLNNLLRDRNELFDYLLEIQEKLLEQRGE